MRVLCSRIQTTASNFSFIIQYLKGRSDFGRSIPQLNVDRMETPNPPHVYDVPEVPTHEYVRLSHRRQCDMLRVRSGPWPHDAPAQVLVGKFIRFIRVRKQDHIRRCDLFNAFSDCVRRARSSLSVSSDSAIR